MSGDAGLSGLVERREWCEGVAAAETAVAEGVLQRLEWAGCAKPGTVSASLSPSPPPLQGYHGDTSRMFYVGNVSPAARQLCDVTKESLDAGQWVRLTGVRCGWLVVGATAGCPLLAGCLAGSRVIGKCQVPEDRAAPPSSPPPAALIDVARPHHLQSAAIKICGPGVAIKEIGRTIHAVADKHKYGVVKVRRAWRVLGAGWAGLWGCRAGDA